MIYFLHIHKSGGSTFVNLALKNGEKLHKPNKNGNPYDDKDKIIPFWDYDKDKLLKFFNKKDFTFCANETCLKQMHIDSKIKYATVLRHPVDTILSCYHHELHGSKSKVPFDKFFSMKILLERNKLAMQKYEKNYFSGPLTYYLSGGRDRQLAEERLRQFDAIIFLENYANDVKIMEKIAGWKVLDINKNRIGTRRNTNAKKELSKDVYEKVCKDLEEDIDFYVKMKSKIKDGKFIN